MRQAGKWIAIGLFCAVFYYIGYLVGNGNIYRNSQGEIKVTGKQTGAPANVDFAQFWRAWKIVDDKYVGNADKQSRVYGAISGMLNSLNDPYTVFLPPAENAQFQEDLSGTFEGIGAEIAIRNGQLTIVAPISSSPAEKAGLKAQDVIMAIDKTPTDEMGLSEAVDKIRGKAGTTVTLMIKRKGWAEPKEFKITRSKITVASVKWEMKQGNIGYISISQFGDDTSTLMKQAAEELNKKNPKAIIVDVRNNPGGLLSEAIDVSGMFVKPDVIVQRKYKDGHIEKDKSKSEPIFKAQKVIILVNGGSASASEIFAGALQDYKKGTLIGEKTFGKGSVQDMEFLDSGAAIKITTAKWLTAKGREVDGKGINPDIEVKQPDNLQDNQDPQLDRALQEANR